MAIRRDVGVEDRDDVGVARDRRHCVRLRHEPLLALSSGAFSIQHLDRNLLTREISFIEEHVGEPAGADPAKMPIPLERRGRKLLARHQGATSLRSISSASEITAPMSTS